MAGYKDIYREAIARGSREGARRVLLQTPQDILEHPYLRRLKYRMSRGEKVTESFEQHLERMRTEVSSFVQSTVDLQTDDDWLAGTQS